MDFITYYQDLLREYKNGPLAVSWGSKESQEIRFKILCDIGNIHNKSILDVGCGLGDLYGYLEDDIVDYTGYDIIPEMVEAAKKKYPNAKFVNCFPDEKFDYVFGSGIFNLKTDNWEEQTYSLIKKMFNSAKIGVGINFLKRCNYKKNEISHYAEPIEILKFVSTLTPKIILRTDYKPNDFTIYLFK